MPEHEATPESSVRLEKAIEATNAMLEFPENRIVRVVLFGSVARGEATSTSDIDMCVTFDNKLTSRQPLYIGGKMDNFLKEKGFQVGTHVSMGLDFTRIRDEYYDVDNAPDVLKARVEEIKREGKVLFPKARI